MWNDISLNEELYEGTTDEGYDFVEMIVEGYDRSGESRIKSVKLVTITGILQKEIVVFRVKYNMTDTADNHQVIKCIEEGEELIKAALYHKQEQISNDEAFIEGEIESLRDVYEINSESRERTITVENPEKALRITIKGQSNKYDGSDLLGKAAVEIMKNIQLDSVGPDPTEEQIFSAFCEMLRENFEYPEEMTHREIALNFLKNIL